MRCGARSTRHVLTVGCMAALLAVAACGGGSEQGGDVAARFALLSGDPLRESPGGELRYLDIETAAEAAGVDPSAAALASQGADGLGLPESWLFPDGWAADADAVAAELGWTLADASWLVEYSTPPSVVAVGAVDVSADDLDQRLGAADDDGVWRLGPEADLQIDETDRTPLRRFGETLRLARSDDETYVARSVAPLLAARDLDGDSVLVDPVVSDLADRLDAAEAYGAVVIVGARADDNGLSAGRFEGLAVGVSGPSAERVTHLFLRHASDADASAHAAVLEQVLDRRPVAREVASWSVAVDGAVVVVEFRHDASTPAGVGFELVRRGDPLTTHR